MDIKNRDADVKNQFRTREQITCVLSLFNMTQLQKCQKCSASSKNQPVWWNTVLSTCLTSLRNSSCVGKVTTTSCDLSPSVNRLFLGNNIVYLFWPLWISKACLSLTLSVEVSNRWQFAPWGWSSGRTVAVSHRTMRCGSHVSCGVDDCSRPVPLCPQETGDGNAFRLTHSHTHVHTRTKNRKDALSTSISS